MFRSEDIQARLRERPFRPLQMIDSEGLRHDIVHPDLVLVGQRDLMIGHPSTENPELYDRVVRLAVVHVVAIEDLPPAAKATNGPT